MENLALWNAVVKTDPSYTKTFRRSGGFEGTAINFAYLARKATEQFGPMGLGWGAEVIDEKYVEGHILKSGEKSITHVVRIKFWYQFPEHSRASIESYGQTTFVGENKNGSFTDEEAPKKSLTDAMSKAMSWLGFGADVHLGLYDDNKYLRDLRHEFEESGKKDEAGKREAKKSEPKKGDEEGGSKAIDKAIPLWKKDIEVAKSLDVVRSLWGRIFSVCKENAEDGGREAWSKIRPLLEARAKELEGSNK